jgi:hypothetical protein
MHHCRRSKKTLKTLNGIIAGEARYALKLGSTSPSLNRKPLSLLTLPAEKQKKTGNPILKKGTIGIAAEWRSNGELAACWNNDCF